MDQTKESWLNHRARTEIYDQIKFLIKRMEEVQVLIIYLNRSRASKAVLLKHIPISHLVVLHFFLQTLSMKEHNSPCLTLLL